MKIRNKTKQVFEKIGSIIVGLFPLWLMIAAIIGYFYLYY